MGVPDRKPALVLMSSVLYTRACFWLTSSLCSCCRSPARQISAQTLPRAAMAEQPRAATCAHRIPRACLAVGSLQTRRYSSTPTDPNAGSSGSADSAVPAQTDGKKKRGIHKNTEKDLWEVCPVASHSCACNLTAFSLWPHWISLAEGRLIIFRSISLAGCPVTAGGQLPRCGDDRRPGKVAPV